MKKLLNILYVQTQGSYLRQEGETVVVERERAVVARIPIHTLSGIVCFGNVLDFESLFLKATLTNSFSDSFGTGAFSLVFDGIYDDGKLSAERTCKSFFASSPMDFESLSRVCPRPCGVERVARRRGGKCPCRPGNGPEAGRDTAKPFRKQVAEADLLDNTPVLDLKPYVPAADAFPDARAG